MSSYALGITKRQRYFSPNQDAYVPTNVSSVVFSENYTNLIYSNSGTYSINFPNDIFGQPVIVTATIAVVGGGGGGGGNDASYNASGGGAGAVITGTITLIGGTTYYIAVGGGGGVGTGSASSGAGGFGGWNGGGRGGNSGATGTSGAGGGGGGWSGIYTGTNTYLVIAGGGAGGGAGTGANSQASLVPASGGGYQPAGANGTSLTGGTGATFTTLLLGAADGGGGGGGGGGYYGGLGQSLIGINTATINSASYASGGGNYYAGITTSSVSTGSGSVGTAGGVSSINFFGITGSYGSGGAGLSGSANATTGTIILRFIDPYYDANSIAPTDTYFKNNSLILSNNVSSDYTPSIDFLLVGGGGGGGYSRGGGGGAGGYITSSSFSIGSVNTLTVIIGAGGAGGTTTVGSVGNPSSISSTGITTQTANGGGYGGSSVSVSGGPGGSGGGGAAANGSGGGITVSGQGTSGGAGYSSAVDPNNGAGGGGGAFSAGSNGTSSAGGAGGAGTFTTLISTSTAIAFSIGQYITATNAIYFSGGGGGSINGYTGLLAGSGGIGGGGNGNSTGIGASSIANSGGGGGGGGRITLPSTDYAGGAGGSGFAIIRYPTTFPAAVTTGTVVSFVENGYRVYSFLTSGVITVGNSTQNTTFIDNSYNGRIVTPSGNPMQGTFSPFGPNWSVYFDGSSSLSVTTSTIFSFGSSANFTIEAWVFWPGTVSSNQTYIEFTSATRMILGRSSTGFRLYNNGTERGFTYTFNATWNHLAVVRYSGSIYVYINGALANTPYADTTAWSHTIVSIGRNSDTAEPLTGYISNIRVINGTALYTATFTVPTAPLSLITNTKLIACSSSRYLDASGTTSTITIAGTPSIQRFSPFSPTGAYNPLIIGGSCYFNGTSDYLSISASAAFGFGTGDFTVEYWFYQTSSVTTEYEIWESQTTNAFIIYKINTSGALSWKPYAGTDQTILTHANVPINTWTHIAVSRASGTTKAFVNGVQVNSVVDSTNYATPTAVYTIGGRNAGSNYFPGYISNFRVIKGTSIYTSAFTPPNLPLRTIDATTSTSLLLNFTNAGMIDQTGLNNLKTVGTASLSTTIRKRDMYKSMSFNGSTDYLSLPTSPAFGFSTTLPYTIEFWIYLNSLPGSKYTIMDFRTASGATAHTVYVSSTGYMGFYNGSADVPSTSSPISAGAWYHVAYSRNTSGILNIFVAGLNVYSAANSMDCGLTRPLTIGASVVPSEYLNGYIDDLRITKGYSRYTLNFRTPTITLK